MPNEPTDLQALEQFVVDNDKLLDLEARIGRFNIFDALRIVDQEIRHSNFLAWLLDPGESHAMGGLFLNAVLMDLLRETPVKDRLFSPIKLDGGELRGVEIRREWRNIDLLITCDEPSFVIAIENKVRAGEHSNQLARYKQIVAESSELSRFEKRQFVFLTKAGDEPSEEDWTIYSYADLHRVLSKVRSAAHDQMGDDVRAFLDHYLRLIGSRFMDDPEIIELCKEIYKNHRQAIDLIIEHNGTTVASISRLISDYMQQQQDEWIVIFQGKNEVKAQHNTWEGVLPPIGDTKINNRGRWVTLNFWVDPNRIKSYIQVGPTTDALVRTILIERLTNDPKEFKLTMARKSIGKNWTALGIEELIRWKENEQPDDDFIIKKIEQHLKRRMKELSELTLAMQDIKQKPTD